MSHYQFWTIADQGRIPLLQEGECDNCGREEILVYYRIRECQRATLWD
ncbi:MAG: hypothetical protein OJF51_001852 [Nitrospira sp.]|nr:MAG: hypothetical protein OJF51_001852 [Nitrospira sp.]